MLKPIFMAGLFAYKEKEEKTFKEKDREKAGSNWQQSETLPAFLR